MPVYALQLDTSVDDEIRRNYNPSKLEEDVSLPPLPAVTRDDYSPVKPSYPTKTTYPKAIYPTKAVESPKVAYPPKISYPSDQLEKITNMTPKGSCVVIKKGTEIRLKLVNSISDRSPKGTPLTFVSIYPVSTTYFTIPMGTVFKGEILNSHKPQLSANGGLIVMNINSMILNDEVHPISAYVVKANYKYIFFNNIKGRRKYVKSMFQSMKPGSFFCKKMMGLAGNLAQDGSSIIMSPFPLAAGLLVLGGNVFISPALALFYKGDSIHFNTGSEFEVQLLQDAFIYN